MNAQLFTALLGQVASDPDQETIWKLQTHWTWAPWFTVLFLVAVVVGIGYLYVRESSPAGTLYRALLATLRLTTIALVLLMLSELLLSSTRSGLPRLEVLLDHSASMGLADVPGRSEQTRLNAARQVLLGDNSQLLADWHQRYALEVATVADGSTKLAVGTPEELVEAIRAVNAESAASNNSRIGDALYAATQDADAAPPAAVVLLTDGRTTAGRSLDEAQAAARRRGVPVFVVGVGPTDAPPDLGLSNLLADEVALAGDLVAMEVTVAAQGIDQARSRVTVTDTSTGDVVQEEVVEIEGGASQVLQLLVQPDRPGAITYRVEVDPLGEERDLENNRVEHTIDVREQKLRVLLAAGYPNYEFRFLKSLLERDSTFELSSYLQEADIDYAAQDAVAIPQLPLSTEAIEEYDVVVLMDLDPRLLPPQWWQSIEHLVVQRGGGLVLVAGPRYFPSRYRQVREIANLAPVEIGSLGGSAGVVDTGFSFELTPLGSQRAAMQLGSTAGESAVVWQGLPPFYWYSDAGEAKPAAQVLAEHPTARTDQGRRVPLVVTQYVGAGRVLYHGVDSTWRWRFRVGDVYFARYWGQTLRHLARSKLSEGEGGAEIVLERGRYDLGEPVRLQLRLADSSQLAGAAAELRLVAEGQAERRLSLQPSRVAPSLLQATASGLSPGTYRVTLSDPQIGEPPAAVQFEVVAPPGELAQPTMNERQLRALASETYGKFYTLEEASRLAEELPLGQSRPLEVLPPFELWNRWWMLAAITGCLSLEWILRKRRGML